MGEMGEMEKMEVGEIRGEPGEPIRVANPGGVDTGDVELSDSDKDDILAKMAEVKDAATESWNLEEHE